MLHDHLKLSDSLIKDGWTLNISQRHHCDGNYIGGHPNEIYIADVATASKITIHQSGS